MPFPQTRNSILYVSNDNLLAPKPDKTGLNVNPSNFIIFEIKILKFSFILHEQYFLKLNTETEKRY